MFQFNLNNAIYLHHITQRIMSCYTHKWRSYLDHRLCDVTSPDVFQVSVLLNLNFHPRDAMLARVLAMALCPSVCLSVTSRCSVEVVGRIEMVFGMQASFDQPYTVFYEIRVSTKIGVLPSGTFS